MSISYDAMTNFLQALVRIKSLAGQEKDAIELTQHEMGRLGFDAVETDIYGNLSGIINGNRPGPTLLLDAHIDTVDVAPGVPWQYEPFGATIDNGRMYGRGTTDMKGPLAAMLYGVAAVDRSTLAGHIVFSVSVMEEVIEGYLLEPVVSKYAPDLVIIGEPSDLKLIHGSRGRAEIHLEAIGRPAHSSLPLLGVNAVHLMMDAVGAIEKIPLPEDPVVGPAVLALTDIISEPYPGHSMIPSLCRVTYDRRTLPGETQEALLGAWSHLKELKDIKAEIGVARYSTYTGEEIIVPKFFPAWHLDRGHDLVLRAAEGLQDKGINAELGTWPFNTNATYTAGIKGIPTIGFGPSKEGLAHIVDEYVDLNDLETAARGYLGMVSHILK